MMLFVCGLFVGMIFTSICMSIYFFYVYDSHVNKLIDVVNIIFNRNIVHEDNIKNLYEDNDELLSENDGLENQVDWLINIVRSKNNLIAEQNNQIVKLKNENERLYNNNVDLNTLLIGKDKEILKLMAEKRELVDE